MPNTILLIKIVFTISVVFFLIKFVFCRYDFNINFSHKLKSVVYHEPDLSKHNFLLILIIYEKNYTILTQKPTIGLTFILKCIKSIIKILLYIGICFIFIII